MVKLARLRQLRQQRFLSQRDLSRQAGVSPKTIVRAERGEEIARFVTARKLARALGVQPQELVEEEAS